jgi:hypothetical protein
MRFTGIRTPWLKQPAQAYLIAGVARVLAALSTRSVMIEALTVRVHDQHGADLAGSVVLVDETASVLDFEWKTACRIQVENAAGSVVPGSTLDLPVPFPPFVPGDTVLLPTTDELLYPHPYGTYADGYPITVRPEDVAPVGDTFPFEVLASGAFDPASFVIAGNTYALACCANQPPVADADDGYAGTEIGGGNIVVHKAK